MRIDVYLASKGFARSRTDAKDLIVNGCVFIDNDPVKKPSFEVDEDDERVRVETTEERFVSRGGLKLSGALSAFGVDACGKRCLDVGASTGGFTDCLLKNGASHVIAVDSGNGQLVESLRTDSRVTVIENYNARFMNPEDLEYAAELAVMDVSFISATYIIPAVYRCIADGAEFICLIKPQFEVGKSGLGKGGIVKDEKVRRKAFENVVSFAESVGFEFLGSVISPIKGGDGNVEFLAHFKKLQKVR